MRIIINTPYIECLLARRNKSKEWFAKRMGIHRSHLSHWLSHKKAPSASNRKKIMDIMRGSGVQWGKLFLIINNGTTTTIYDFDR